MNRKALSVTKMPSVTGVVQVRACNGRSMCVATGKPTDNASVESFNGTFRCECQDTHGFTDLKEAKHQIEAWRQE